MIVRTDGDELDISFRVFHRPMGLSSSPSGITLGVFTEVLHFQREDGLLEQLKRPLDKIEQDPTAPRLSPKQPPEHDALLEKNTEGDVDFDHFRGSLHQAVDDRADACFIMRSAHTTGMINVHDVDWGELGLWVVNSSFSCLATLQPDFSFVPRWKPHFISELLPEDRCHLNGMALRDGKPAYVTTFSQFNEKTQWRKQKDLDGTLIDVTENKVLIDSLTMPHSPRWYRGAVYFCNSGLGQICRFDPETRKLDILAEVPGFTRGLDFFGDILFVGLSKVRQSDVSRPAPLANKHETTFSGVWLFDCSSGEEIGYISFSGNVDQIYDVAVLEDCCFPELLDASHPRIRNHFCFPELID